MIHSKLKCAAFFLMMSLTLAIPLSADPPWGQPPGGNNGCDLEGQKGCSDACIPEEFVIAWVCDGSSWQPEGLIGGGGPNPNCEASKEACRDWAE